MGKLCDLVIFFILLTVFVAPILFYTDLTVFFKIPFAKRKLLEEDVTTLTINADENSEPPRMIREPVRVFRDDERELILRIKEVEQALVEQVLADFSKDLDLPKTALEEKLKAMEQTLAKVKQIQYDCTKLVRKLYKMLHSAKREGQSVYYTLFTDLFIPLAVVVIPTLMLWVINSTKESTSCSTSSRRTVIYK